MSYGYKNYRETKDLSMEGTEDSHNTTLSEESTIINLKTQDTPLSVDLTGINLETQAVESNAMDIDPIEMGEEARESQDDKGTIQEVQKHLEYYKEMTSILEKIIKNNQSSVPPLPKRPTTNLEILLGLKVAKTKKKLSGKELHNFLKSKLTNEKDVSFKEIEGIVSFDEITVLLKKKL
ncbi:uncharacterized protein LOC141910502 [Tubulanus polymorphus]|uniref:uncharacterized protein LOC141910502 n=1 Tax=Tubulanus polymorphus TaxID=672921 RepID=UPI003DA2477A